jgi:hypothetical protein
MKQPDRKMLVLGIVVLMMAGACAAPAAPNLAKRRIG